MTDIEKAVEMAARCSSITYCWRKQKWTASLYSNWLGSTVHKDGATAWEAVQKVHTEVSVAAS